MKVVSQAVIFSGRAQTPFASCCFPAIVRLEDATALATWRVGSRKDSSDGKLLISRSSDAGASWSAPQEIPLGPYAELKGEAHYGPLTVLGPNHLLAAMMWVDRSDPDLPLYHPQTEGLLPLRTLFCESRDAGQTWDNYREMDRAPYYSPLAITGPVVKLADGRLACQFEVNKNYEETQPWRHAAAWKISNDSGHTWPDCVEIARDPSGRLMYWDARYAIGTGGFCLAAFWTYDRERQRDTTIHLSISDDDGRRWSAPRDTGIIGQIAHPVLLDDGRLLLIYIDRYESCSIRALLSDDLGRSFHSEAIVYQHPRTHAEAGQSAAPTDYLQAMDVWTFGRVDGVAEADGFAAIAFYAGTPEATNIHWLRLATRAPTTNSAQGREPLSHSHSTRATVRTAVTEGS